MRFDVRGKWLIGAAVLAAWLIAVPEGAACSVCFGNPEAPMNQGMAWGIATLLGVIGLVLIGIAGMGVFFVRRASSAPQTTEEVAMDPAWARAFGGAAASEPGREDDPVGDRPMEAAWTPETEDPEIGEGAADRKRETVGTSS